MSIYNLERAEQLVREAHSFPELFGHEKDAEKNYRRLMSMTHSDKYEGCEESVKVRAARANDTIHELWKRARVRMEQGTYGKKPPKQRAQEGWCFSQGAGGFEEIFSNGFKRTVMAGSNVSMEELLELVASFTATSLNEERGRKTRVHVQG